ncbi:MAG: hypothetical protein PCALPYG88_0066 [uncultured Paraburkholderia sp.]|nr:MAG: hypothetical protein PCALPYG08_0067 [uncultured Paraburkholderia sp.]CAH2907700.1 MAG: hypothetical protein PCALPYG88_0066 [uncultured Paraburkholderia sp.]
MIKSVFVEAVGLEGVPFPELLYKSLGKSMETQQQPARDFPIFINDKNQRLTYSVPH